MTNDWYEVRLAKGADRRAFYRELLGLENIERLHHFWDEPWWPGAYVVRVLTHNPYLLDDLPGVDHVVPWDAAPDEELYGRCWPHVARLFEASTMISENHGYPFNEKIVHCVLNARGMSVWDEARFAARFAWHRVTLKPRLYWRALRSRSR